MVEAQFWSVIESGGPDALDDPEQQLEAIQSELSQLSPNEVRDFYKLFNQKMAYAYDWNLWGAAYLINGGCSDDGFAYFRAWLISRGQRVYEAAVQNPDSLVDIVDPERDDYEFEDIWYIAQDVYEELTGREMPSVNVSELIEPRGEQWDYHADEEITQRFPKLSKVYLA